MSSRRRFVPSARLRPNMPGNAPALHIHAEASARHCGETCQQGPRRRPPRAYCQHEESLRADGERHPGHRARPQRTPLVCQPHRGQWGASINRSAASGITEEGKSKIRKKPAGPPPTILRAAPQIARKAVRDPAAEQGVERARQPQPPARLAAQCGIQTGANGGLSNQMSRYSTLPARICCAAASGNVSSAHRISTWHSRAASEQREQQQKNSRVLFKLWAQTLAGIFASRRSSAIRKSAPYSGSASANSTKLSK